MAWKEELTRANDLNRIRDFGEACCRELPQPTQQMGSSTKVLHRTNDLDLARDAALTIATEVLSRVQELRFFGDRSVASPQDLSVKMGLPYVAKGFNP